MNLKNFIKSNKNFCFGLGSIGSYNDQYFIDQALDLGIRIFDTAEEYGESEKVLGKSLSSCNDDVFVVTKVLPSNVYDITNSCYKSLKNLSVDKINLYLIHGYDNSVDPKLIVEKMSEIKEKGLIDNWGVSHYNYNDIEDLKKLNGQCDANQILYSLNARNFENHLQKVHEKYDITTMCYSIFRGMYKDEFLINNELLINFCSQRNITPAKLIFDWVCRHENLVPVVFSKNKNHLTELLNPLNTLDEYLNDIELIFPKNDNFLLDKKVNKF